jgi:F-type H+-transporting ATPase subunit a
MESPLEQFAIRPLFHLPVAGYDLAFTNSSLAMLIAFLVTAWLFTAGTAKAALVPGRLQSTAETMYQFIESMIDDNIGHHGHAFFPLIFSIFMIVLLGNVLGMIPGNFTYTSHIIVTASLAVFIFLLVIAIGIIRNGPKWFGIFLPSGVPLWLAPIMVPVEIISFLSRPISLSVRLFANMLAGHVIMHVFAGFCVLLAGLLAGFGILLSLAPLGINVALTGLELLVACLQAYVFAVMSCIYLRDAVDVHH